MKMDSKQRFRKLLTESGWSQAEAARQLGMTPSALSQIVRPNSPVQPSKMTIKFFQALLGGTLPPKPTETWENEILDTMRELTPSTRRAILQIAHQFTKQS